MDELSKYLQWGPTREQLEEQRHVLSSYFYHIFQIIYSFDLN